MNPHFEQSFKNVKSELEKPELIKLASKSLFMSGAVAIQDEILKAIGDKHPEVLKLVATTVAQTHVQFSDSVWAEKDRNDGQLPEAGQAAVLPFCDDQNP